MKPIFVIGDVHGEIGLLEKILEDWDRERERLLFVGDLIDRGENPGAVLRLVKELSLEEEVIVLTGNHEKMLLDWLAAPSEKMAYYISQGGMETIQSLLPENIEEKVTPEELAKRVMEESADLITFIENLPLFYEEKQYVFVHAGVDLTISDWKKTEEKQFYWIREPFLFGENHTGKVFIFGHTPVQNLHSDGSSNIWISPDQTRLDIDGGAVYGGSLNAIVVEEHAVTKLFRVDK
ncbi:serine/threonine protein phosphatase [Listeria fleischmannii 1991]|uniref:Serine/threonine-protein phosphatase 1 n=2 Tax=Listeria fleischmannii TaxID=1069827 RepID=A0A2X3HIG7_9LIST|nr:metallophosphoesterase [Listeria fleischmannii]EMG28631.1 serine/threonine protein phosphatase [Listeria fleischmannii subsp. fleischmannii LU2006-1]KMT59676.1 serine/threonine protein phosphatase [Listeria fleischmannii 1991]SQC72353.1 Serine/threonine-protein phosphatase 1 [Listeria fleischmannii subsp. fleischmannii]